MKPYSGVAASFARFRSLILTNAAAAIKTTPGVLHRLNITNLHSAAIFVKLYDGAVADVTVGTTAPVNVFQVGANAQLVVPLDVHPLRFGTAITAAVVTGGADNNTTAAATLPIIEAEVE
jgi:hypothetical protein